MATVIRPDEAFDADEIVAGAGTVIHVDAESGEVVVTNADGSMDVGGPRDESKTDAEFDANLADRVDGTVLATIVQRLLEGIDADKQARSEWIETANKGADYLGIKIDDATGEIGAGGSVSQVHHTMLLEACMRSWSNSIAELLPVSGPVKVRDDRPPVVQPPGMGHNGAPPLAEPLPVAGAGMGRPPEGVIPFPGAAGMGAPGMGAPGMGAAPAPELSQIDRNQLATALEKDFNHYLTVTDKEYYPDTSRMLFSRALLGCQFKKVYWDPLLRRPVSRWVKGSSLIVSNDCSHLEGAGRVTEEIKMRQAIVRRLQVSGHWRDVPLIMPAPVATPTEQKVAEVEGVRALPQLPQDLPRTIYECYCELDNGILGQDETGREVGFPLPYRVTIERDSRVVLEIRRNWKRGDPDYRARRRYVKFGFVPGLGFYDLGFIHILGNAQRAVTAIERMLIDGGMFASFPGGLIAKGANTRQTTSQIRMSPGEFFPVDTAGLPINQAIMPLPYKEPSQVLMATGAAIAADGRRTAGILELPVGEGRVGDVPATTIMAYVDAISKVPSAVHKADHMAQQEEFELLRELFMEDPEALCRGVRRPAHRWTCAAELEDQDLVPAADPNVPSQMHRLMQARTLVEAGGLPQFQGIANQRAIWDWVTRTLQVGDPSALTLPPQQPGAAPPDPKVIAAQQKAAGDAAKTQAKMAEVRTKAAVTLQEATLESADRAADRQTQERVAMLNVQRAQITEEGRAEAARIDNENEVSQAEADREQADRHHAEEMADKERDRATALAKATKESQNKAKKPAAKAKPKSKAKD